jgi:hypothetical protein
LLIAELAMLAGQFAQISWRFQRHYSLALRFYSEAFRADSKLETNPLLGHRYDAARCAALAADGKGIDPPDMS